MLPKHIKEYIKDRFTVEDIIWELDLDINVLVDALDRNGVDLRIFEEHYNNDSQMDFDFEQDEQD